MFAPSTGSTPLIRAACTLLLACASPAQAAPEEFNLDLGHTFPTFEVRHLNVATQRGRFNRSSGKLTLDLAAGSGAVQVSMASTSVDTGNDELDKLLRGKYYFNADEYPEITYRSTAFVFADGKPSVIKGELTFLGQTHPVELKVQFFGCSRLPFLGQRCGADLSGKFLRSEFGMTAMQGFVGDEVTLLIQAEAVKGAAPEAPKP